MFIAVVGISAGPSFVQGLKEVGPMLFIIGALATSLPLLLGLILARYVFKFHPALSLGCTAGARTTTAALGAIQEAVGSETPSLGDVYKRQMLYYNWGFALHNQFGITASCLAGIVFFILQFSFCRWWMNHHSHGPMEYIWKRATWLK